MLNEVKQKIFTKSEFTNLSGLLLWNHGPEPRELRIHTVKSWAWRCCQISAGFLFGINKKFHQYIFTCIYKPIYDYFKLLLSFII